MNLARMIDHTLLRAEAAEADIRQLVAQAADYRFASVCVNGRWVALASQLLRQANAYDGDAGVADGVKVCAVAGFPLGAGKSSVKAIEAVAAVKDGAREIDMVIGLDALLAGNLEEARSDIYQVVKAARAAARETIIKVILETAALTDAQIALGCQAAREAGADFVKTSTGFHSKGGATEDAVRALVKYAGGLSVKASGGIRDRATAEKYIALGASRIGTSNGVAMLSAS
ncbi:MAG TPA: deoxyribose-phosphate aldolase [Phycisphaerae bacterium]